MHDRFSRLRTVPAGAWLAVCLALAAGCGHVQTSRIGLISFGNLEGRTIPDAPRGPVLCGSDAAQLGWPMDYYLSQAARNALQGTTYDTLVDVATLLVASTA